MKNIILGIVSLMMLSTTSLAMQKNRVDYLLSNPEYSTLVDLLVKADLVTQLSSIESNLTILAPTNRAFERFQKKNPELFEQVLADKDLLTKVLLTHVYPFNISEKTIVNIGAKLTGLGDVTPDSFRSVFSYISMPAITGDRVRFKLTKYNGYSIYYFLGGTLPRSGYKADIVEDVTVKDGVILKMNNSIINPLTEVTTDQNIPSIISK